MKLSQLGHTWILDLDGTILKHNGYKIDGKDSFLENAESFLSSIPENDMIIFLTSRTDSERALTEAFLLANKVRYATIVYNAPYGERILVNDDKPTGLKTCYGVAKMRDSGEFPQYMIDSTL